MISKKDTGAPQLNNIVYQKYSEELKMKEELNQAAQVMLKGIDENIEFFDESENARERVRDRIRLQDFEEFDHD